MLGFEGGQGESTDELCRKIQAAHRAHTLEGITLLGGEPFSQAVGASILARFAHSLDLTVMIFSGHLLNELRESPTEGVADLLAHTDMLVDGPYDCSSPDTSRRWIGSTNQQVHFLTDRYSAEDSYWAEADTLEVRLQNGELSVNGFPAKSAVGIWKRPKPQK
jgi:anaerobic ribonucleoside-triphosphate reductase activating protein